MIKLNKKEEKAITLVALIITIVVLIVLASVVIKTLTGDDNIINYAIAAGEEYQIQSIRETVNQGIIEASVEKGMQGEKLTLEEALVKLQEKNIFEEIEEDSGIKNGYVIWLGYDANGNIVITAIEKDAKVRIKVVMNPTGYTKENVEVELKIKENGEKITSVEIPKGMELKGENRYEISKNGNYLVKVYLENNEKIEKNIQINQIDKLPPEKFEITIKEIENGIEVKGELEDLANEESVSSGIEKYEYVITTPTGETKTYTENRIECKEAGKYQIYAIAYDRAKNTTQTETIEFEIKRKYKEVSSGFAIDIDGNLWGTGQYSGDGTTTNRINPVQVKAGTMFCKVSAGNNFTLAIDTEGNLWAWGFNGNGRLGDGTTTQRLSPIQIKTGTKFNEISCGMAHALAIDTEGNLWGWGINDYGQLGNGTTTNSSIPVQIKAGTKFGQIAAGDRQSLAIDEAGNLWGWGGNGNGQNGTGADRLSPAQVKTGTTFNKVSAGETHAVAIDTEGNLWAWGFNGYQQLGDGTTTDRSSPVQIKAGTTFKEISGGQLHTLAIDTAGNLWRFGRNPILIEETKFKKVSGGSGEIISFAIDEVGNLWTWGITNVW